MKKSANWILDVSFSKCAPMRSHKKSRGQPVRIRNRSKTRDATNRGDDKRTFSHTPLIRSLPMKSTVGKPTSVTMDDLLKRISRIRFLLDRADRRLEMQIRARGISATASMIDVTATDNGKPLSAARVAFASRENRAGRTRALVKQAQK
jgi:hypothetical protein